MAEVTVLGAGERLRISAHGSRLDKPSLEKVTAWQRGQLVFEDTPLSEAVAEFNRYGPITVAVRASDAEGIRVGGTFGTGDSMSFATAVAQSHHLRLRQSNNQVMLEKWNKQMRIFEVHCVLSI